MTHAATLNELWGEGSLELSPNVLGAELGRTESRFDILVLQWGPLLNTESWKMALWFILIEYI